MISNLLLQFYRLWHGKLHLKGAGFLLTKFSKIIQRLQSYPLSLPEGNSIMVDFRDVSSMYWLNHLLGDKFEEDSLLIAMKQFIKNGDVFWDIGSNSGLLSYNIAKSFQLAELHLFEPNPNMYRLSINALSTFPFIRVHEFGISDQKKELTLSIPTGHSTTGTLEASMINLNNYQCKVNCRSGDELVFSDEFTPPHIIKIDTEGHELSVLAGIKQIISTYRPVIFLEHISIDYEYLKVTTPRDYLLFTISDNTGKLIANSNGHEGHNSALIPQELINDRSQ